MNNIKKSIEISILKAKGRASLEERYHYLSDEENRIAALLTNEDEILATNLHEVQTERAQLMEQLMAILDKYDEVTYFRGYSFIDVYFNKSKEYGQAFQITQEDVAKFLSECDLVLDNPKVAESILPVKPNYETPKYAEDDTEHIHPIYYDEEYITRVRTARDKFNEIFTTNDWSNDTIYLEVYN